MKTILRIEEAAMTLAALYLLSFYSLGISVWIWCILFFLPDLSIIGYAGNARTGALLYNFFHHKGVAIATAALGYLLANEILIAVGVLMFAHASFDRILGYGLKYETGFQQTHLGSLRKESKEIMAA